MRAYGFAWLAASLVSSVVTATQVRADNWADTADPAYAKSTAICRTLKDRPLPGLAPGEKSSAPCDSSELYYGIKHAADPGAARLCAQNHRASSGGNPDDPFDGVSLLATIYANGRGAPRDLDIAINFACRIDGASAEMDARILHLDKLKGGPKPADDFDICDDLTSSLLAGACEALDADRKDAGRAHAIQALETRLTAPQKAALLPLRKAANAYVTALGDNEVDSSGTLRVAMVIGAEQEQQTAFLKLLQAMIEGTSPKADVKSFAAADKALNATYGAVMRVKDPSVWGSVDKAGIKTVQIAWLAYRDAFVAFARTMAPDGGTDGIRTELTKQRTEQLGNFTPDK